MKFSVIDVEHVTIATGSPYNVITLKYDLNSADVDASLLKDNITTQDEYDLMVGREFREAMVEFLKNK